MQVDDAFSLYVFTSLLLFFFFNRNKRNDHNNVYCGAWLITIDLFICGRTRMVLILFYFGLKSFLNFLSILRLTIKINCLPFLSFSLTFLTTFSSKFNMASSEQMASFTSYFYVFDLWNDGRVLARFVDHVPFQIPDSALIHDPLPCHQPICLTDIHLLHYDLFPFPSTLWRVINYVNEFAFRWYHVGLHFFRFQWTGVNSFLHCFLLVLNTTIFTTKHN